MHDTDPIITFGVEDAKYLEIFAAISGGGYSLATKFPSQTAEL